MTSTLKLLASDLLEATNPYNRPIELIKYNKGDLSISLISLVDEHLEKRKSTTHKADVTICFLKIAEAMEEYLESYPASHSFKQHTIEVFSKWLERITDYSGFPELKESIADYFVIDKRKNDTAITMLKALHRREGITKEGLAEELGNVSKKDVQKSLRKIDPSLSAEGSAEISTPFKIGGIPVEGSISTMRHEGDRKTYYRTNNTVHPVVLMENMFQVYTLITSLARNYYSYESNACISIGLDIWWQLSDYAREKVVFLSRLDEETKSFIDILESECPGDSAAPAFRLEEDIRSEISGISEALMYLVKVPERACNIAIKDESGRRVWVENAHVSFSGKDSNFIIKTGDGAIREIDESQIIDVELL